MSTQTLTAEHIIKLLDQHAERLRELGALKIGLFGSVVRGEGVSGSDIDLLVTLADSSFDTYCDVLFYLEDLLGRKVDLVPEDSVRPELRPHILAEVRYATRV